MKIINLHNYQRDELIQGNMHLQYKHFYGFQIMKCKGDKCSYCTLKPPRCEKFEEFDFLPDPTLKDDDHWMDFKDLYRTATNDLQRPSLKALPSGKDEDNKQSKVLVTGMFQFEFDIEIKCLNFY